MPDDDVMPEGTSAALKPDEGAVVPRIRLGETGFAALRMSAGQIREEANRVFQYPAMLRVVDEMLLSPPVSIGLNAINTLLCKAEVIVEPITGATEEDLARAEFLRTCLGDMDQSFQTILQQVSTYLPYGHQVSEKVYRRRLKKNGSKYNDGLIGISGLKSRPQNSIAKWNFDESGRNLVSVSQNISAVENSYRYSNLKDKNGYIVIPREKFILFRASPTTDNPEGNSLLKSAYLAYKQLTLLTESMLVGVAKDAAGLPLIQIPPKYMGEDASPEEASVYQSALNIADQIANGQQKAIVFPMVYDQGSNLPLFTVSLLESKGGAKFNVESIIKNLQATILSVLSCDAVKMSAEDAGSLNTQDGNVNMLALAVEYRLSEIANTLNQDLVPQLWELNGWDKERMPKIAFEKLSQPSLEIFSKSVQRLASTGTMELNRKNLNVIYKVMGFPIVPEDVPVDVEALPAVITGKASKSGEGMKSGVGEGTRRDPFGAEDAPTNNNDNTA